MCWSAPASIDRSRTARPPQSRGWALATRCEASRWAAGPTGERRVPELSTRPSCSIRVYRRAARVQGGCRGAQGGYKGASRARRVLLLDSPQHTEKLVVHVITTVVTGTSEEHALNCHATARKLGQAIVTSCLQEHAEFYALQMAKSGVKCTIEPDSTVI